NISSLIALHSIDTHFHYELCFSLVTLEQYLMKSHENLFVDKLRLYDVHISVALTVAFLFLKNQICGLHRVVVQLNRITVAQIVFLIFHLLVESLMRRLLIVLIVAHKFPSRKYVFDSFYPSISTSVHLGEPLQLYNKVAV